MKENRGRKGRRICYRGKGGKEEKREEREEKGGNEKKDTLK